MRRSRLPIRKVTVGGVAGFLVTAAVWAVAHFAHKHVGSAELAAIGLVAQFVAAYLTPLVNEYA